MDLSSKKDIKNLLKGYQIRPSRGLGQNFLIDKKAINRFIRATELNSEDIVLEIGPGLGSLTQELAKRARRVIAIEKDQKMVEILSETLKDFNNTEVIKDDILKIFNSLPLPAGFNYKVAGNLPFYLTAPIIRKFLESEDSPKTMVLVVQKEVGQRICAKPGKMSILAVSVQVYAEPKIISYISKKSFWPQPKVDSAIIKITPHRGENLTIVRFLPRDFFKVVKAGFSQPRKQLINNLTKQLNFSRVEVEKWLMKNNIKPTQRAETLSVKDWLSLTKTIK